VYQLPERLGNYFTSVEILSDSIGGGRGRKYVINKTKTSLMPEPNVISRTFTFITTFWHHLTSCTSIQYMAHNQEQDGSLLTSPSVVLDTIISEPYAGLCFSILIDGSAFNLLGYEK
jgi:hypothetical protein